MLSESTPETDVSVRSETFAIQIPIIITIFNGIAPITQLHTCIIKIVTFKGGQLVDFPTRKSKTLDLIFSSHPSYMERCKPLPSIGNSNHDIVLLDTSIQVRRPKPPRRRIYLWKSADINGIQEDLTHFAADFKDRPFDSVNSMWDSFKEQIHKSMDRRVPSKMTLARHTHPWMNGRIRRLIRRKQRAHKKARTTGIKRDMDRYRRLQHDVQFQIRSAHKDFMKTAVSDTFKDNPKKFC